MDAIILLTERSDITIVITNPEVLETIIRRDRLDAYVDFYLQCKAAGELPEAGEWPYPESWSVRRE